MKTRKSNLTTLSLLGLTAVALILFATVGQAEATVRVAATVRTPYGVVHVDNGRADRTPRTVCEVLPVRRLVSYRLHDDDRRMAKRLAWYTGISKHEILDLRRDGYRWDEIGRWLGVHRRVIRAAESKHSWQRFVDHERRYERCSTGLFYEWDDDREDRYSDNRGHNGRERDSRRGNRDHRRNSR